MLLEHLTPARLYRLLPVLGGADGLPRQTGSEAWFVWRALERMDVPAALPVITQELPQHADVLASIGENWVTTTPLGTRLVLEFAEPDGRISSSDIEALITSLRLAVSDQLSLTGIFYGTPHLRPRSVILLELSADEETIRRLLGSDELLLGIRPGGCPLQQVHAESPQVWSRPAEVGSRIGAGVLAVCLTGVGLMLVLALIAIPNFVNMGSRAKRAEVPPNVDGIKTAEVAYDAAFDRFISQPEFVPEGPVGKQQRDWPAGTAFDTLGWAPDGRVRGSYRAVTLSCGSATCKPTDFRVYGISDADGDGEQSTYTAQKSSNAVRLTPNSIW